jgi:hypothetical protein
VSSAGARLAGSLRPALCVAIAATALASCGDGAPSPSVPAPAVPPAAAKLPRIAAGGPPLLGYNENFAEDPVPAGLIASSGASFVRTPLNWATVEPEEGLVPNWAPYDAIYRGVIAAGTRPLWAISSAPCWAADFDRCDSPRPGVPPDPDHVEAFAQFAAAVAERYPQSLAIEIWNEPNYARFWAGGLDPELYAELLAASARAIHGADGEMPVIAAGLAPFLRGTPSAAGTARGPGGRLPLERFVDAIYDSDAGSEIDGVGVHLYPLIDPAEPPLRAVARQLAAFRSAIARAGGGEPPIWVTETGVSTAGATGVGPAAQARELTGIVGELDRRDVRLVAIHRLFDDAAAPAAAESGFGTVRADRTTRKPAFCAVAALGGERCR